MKEELQKVISKFNNYSFESNEYFCLKVKGILSIHELHVWKLSGNKIIATAHITCHNLEEYMIIASKVKILFHEKGIHSTTIQPEFVDVSFLNPN